MTAGLTSPYPLPGTPVELVDLPLDQTEWSVSPEVRLLTGVNPEVARLVAADTGDAIVWPFINVSIHRPSDQSVVAVVAYGYDRASGRMYVSGMACGSLWSVALFRQVLEIAFGRLSVFELVAQLREGDDDAAVLYRRLGFRFAGYQNGRRLFALRRGDFSPWCIRRANLRDSVH